VKAVYVERHYGEPEPAGADVAVASLAEAAAWIQQQEWATEGRTDD
jgi:hypothetical protein